MSVALAVTPASGSITAKSTVVRIDVTGGNPDVTARLKLTASGQTTLISPSDFRPSSDGNHTWFSVMFPAAGSWTATLYKSSDDTSLATLGITVA